MTRRSVCALVIAALVCGFAAAPAHAEPFSDDGRHDLGALLDEARQFLDLAAEDAVILLEQERHLWTADQRRLFELHRVVWIGTARGIRSYADLRVPWDSVQQSLEVATLRSWRPLDRRWTASGPTAIVDTTPYAFGRAVDYTGVRETMLLTDGVELPCILEVRYVIEDREAFAGGIDDVRVLARDDPCLISELTLGAPADAALEVASSGVELAESHRDETRGLTLDTYRAERLEPLPWPHPASSEVAHVAWSSWPDHDALEGELSARFDAAARLDDASREAAAAAAASARSEIERAEQLAAWVAEATTFVAYDRRWFPQPRAAHRSWATAYAHALDRAVLAAAGLRAAGLSAELAYRRPRGVAPPPEVATLATLEGPLLWVAGDGFEALYDPPSSTLAVAAPALADGSLWRFGEARRTPAPTTANRALLRFDLAWQETESTWQGRGLLQADGILSPFAAMQGLEPGRASALLEKLSAAVLDGATLGDCNFERFQPAAVHAGFRVTIEAGDRDAQGRLRLVIGDPSASLNDPLHAVGGLHQAERSGTVHLPAPVELVVELHLEPAALERVHLPTASELRTGAGSFRLELDEDDQQVVIRRSLVIDDGEVSSEEWRELRRLLLANASPRHRTLLFK